jgi:D-sedoheptulose 7-phosphate isomerase
MPNPTASFIHRQIAESIAAKQALLDNADLLTAIETLAERIVAVYRDGGKVLIAGNGGSAADAQHIAAELVSRFTFDRPALPAIALTTDSSILTGIGNDYGYETLFSRQVEAMGRPGDLFIGISTSGNSPNILKALEAAKANGIIAVGLTGASGGRMAALCDHCLKMPSDNTPRIQECHITIGHILCAHTENTLFGGV